MSTVTIEQTTVSNWSRGGSTVTLRIVANDNFITSDLAQVFSSNIDHGPFYQTVNCTVSGTTLTIPSFTIDSTTDSSNPNATYTAVLYDSGGARAGTYWANHKIPTTTPVSQAYLQTYNAAPQHIRLEGYPTVDQVQVMINDRVSIGASVNSAEHASVVTRVDSVANAVSVVSATRAAEDGLLSARIDSVVGIGGVTSADHASAINRISANSAQMTSADVALSNTVSQLAVAAANLVANEAVERASADAALSARIGNLGIDELADVNIGLATDGQVLVFNASAVEWRNSTAAGGTASVTSAEHASVVTRVDSVVDRLSGISATVSSNSADVTSLKDRVSGISAAVSANSAQMTSADNAISAAQAVTSAAVTSVNTRIGGVSADLTSTQTRLTNLSAQVTSADNAISNAVSVGDAALSLRITSVASIASAAASAAAVVSANVTSVAGRLDTVSAGLTSVDSRVTSIASIASAAASAVSAVNSNFTSLKAEITSGLGSRVQLGVAADTSVSAAMGLTKIANLSTSCVANGVYQIEGFLMHSMSGVSVFGFALSLQTGTMKNAAFGWRGNLSVGTGVSGLSTTIAANGWSNEAGFGSVTYSVLATQAGNLQTRLEGLFAMSTTGGSIQVKARTGTSGCITIKAGSYLRAFRIA